MKQLLILGKPSEDFVEGLREVHGDIPIRILEGHEFKQSREVFLSEVFQWVLQARPFVVTYSTGWHGEISLLGELFGHLTGRSPESVQYFLFDMGVEVKSHSFTKGLISIKDLMNSMDQSALSEEQRLRLQVLGELIR